METCLALLAFIVIATVILFGALIAWALISAIHEWLDPEERAKRQRLKERVDQFQQKIEQHSTVLNPMVHEVLVEAAMILRPPVGQDSRDLPGRPFREEEDFFVGFHAKSGTWQIVWRRKVKPPPQIGAIVDGRAMSTPRLPDEVWFAYTVVLTPGLARFAVYGQVPGKHYVRPPDQKDFRNEAEWATAAERYYSGHQYVVCTGGCIANELRNALLAVQKDFGPGWSFTPYYGLDHAGVSDAFKQKLRDTVFSAYGTPKSVQEEAHTWYRAGLFYATVGLYQEAIGAYSQAIERFPKFAEAYSARGYSYVVIGQYERAREDVSSAIRLNPELADAFNTWGWLHYAQGKWEQAIEKGRTAISLNPDAAYSRYNLGLYLLAAGMRGESLEVYRQAIGKTQYVTGDELKGAIADLKELRAQRPTIGGVEDALNLLLSAVEERGLTSK